MKIPGVKYKCIIADDNMLERDLLQVLLERTGMAEIVASCKDGLEAYQAINTHEVDLVFTDVDMPQLNGLELVKSLKQQPVFVFISSHAEYALDGYELDVADFILKPVQMERLLRALEKAKAFVQLKRSEAAQQHPPVHEVQGEQFFIRASEGLVQLQLADITHMESMGNFSKIYTVQGGCHLTLVSLKSLSAQLPSEWMVRVHRQYIINIRQINSIDAASVKVGGVYSIPLGSPYRQELMDKVAAKTILRNPNEQQADRS